MAKKIKKALAIILALNMCMSLLSLEALAADMTAVIEVPTLPGGEEETVNVIISVTKDGNVTETEITTQSPDGEVTESGLHVELNSSEIVVTDAEGEVLFAAGSGEYHAENEDQTYGADGGSETSSEAVAPTGTVNIPVLDPDAQPSTETVSGTPVGTTEVTGDTPTSPDDGEYRYTEKEVVTQGEITVVTQPAQFETHYDSSDSELDYVCNEEVVTADNDMFLHAGSVDMDADYSDIEAADGYSYVILGIGNSSQFYSGILYTSPATEDEEPAYIGPDGTKYYTRRGKLTGKYVLEGAYQNGELVDPDAKFGGIWSNVSNYVIVDTETDQLITTYCADLNTPTEDYFSYNMHNIEDRSYYTAEQAAMIRTVANVGYWGTIDDPATEEAEYGSLESVKETMRNAVDENGQRIFTDEEIDSLSDGAAMTATQFAIWTFSNEMEGVAFLNTQYIKKNENLIGNSGWSYLSDVPESEKDTVDLIFKLYDYMINLDPTQPAYTTADTIINEQNFINDMSLTVVDKAKWRIENRDDNPDNDAYVTNVSFSLVVTPSEENEDDLVVSILNENNEEIARGRIAGEPEEGEIMLSADENGYYTFSNIVLTEGEQNINITLEGVQNLQEGVYLYTSEVVDGVGSQTMVGVASGKRDVDVSMKIRFDLDVQDEVIVTEHVWRDEWVEEEPEVSLLPGDDDDDDGYGGFGDDDGYGGFGDDDGGYTEIPDEDVPTGLVNIPDEIPPLANLPHTGDISVAWTVISFLSGSCLVGLGITGKKKDEE